MSSAVWIGALLGLVFTHSLIGALLGAIFGMVFDGLRISQQRHATPKAGGFIEPLFALIGAVAKSDGRVSPAEIAVAECWMTRFGLNAEQRRLAIDSFNRGKESGFDITGPITELRTWAGLRRDHAFSVLDVVIGTVLSDGAPGPGKLAILRQLAFALRISEMELAALMAMKGYAWQGSTHSPGGGGYVPPRQPDQGPDPYAVLGVPHDADDRAIKRAYRKLISEHHPDRLGDLPENMRRRAEERASEINRAYEKIKSAKGFKY